MTTHWDAAYHDLVSQLECAVGYANSGSGMASMKSLLGVTAEILKILNSFRQEMKVMNIVIHEHIMLFFLLFNVDHCTYHMNKKYSMELHALYNISRSQLSHLVRIHACKHKELIQAFVKKIDEHRLRRASTTSSNEASTNTKYHQIISEILCAQPVDENTPQVAGAVYGHNIFNLTKILKKAIDSNNQTQQNIPSHQTQNQNVAVSGNSTNSSGAGGQTLIESRVHQHSNRQNTSSQDQTYPSTLSQMLQNNSSLQAENQIQPQALPTQPQAQSVSIARNHPMAPNHQNSSHQNQVHEAQLPSPVQNESQAQSASMASNHQLMPASQMLPLNNHPQSVSGANGASHHIPCLQNQSQPVSRSNDHPHQMSQVQNPIQPVGGQQHLPSSQVLPPQNQTHPISRTSGHPHQMSQFQNWFRPVGDQHQLVSSSQMPAHQNQTCPVSRAIVLQKQIPQIRNQIQPVGNQHQFISSQVSPLQNQTAISRTTGIPNQIFQFQNKTQHEDAHQTIHDNQFSRHQNAVQTNQNATAGTFLTEINTFVQKQTQPNSISEAQPSAVIDQSCTLHHQPQLNYAAGTHPHQSPRHIRPPPDYLESINKTSHHQIQSSVGNHQLETEAIPANSKHNLRKSSIPANVPGQQVSSHNIQSHPQSAANQIHPQQSNSQQLQLNQRPSAQLSATDFNVLLQGIIDEVMSSPDQPSESNSPNVQVRSPAKSVTSATSTGTTRTSSTVSNSSTVVNSVDGCRTIDTTAENMDGLHEVTNMLHEVKDNSHLPEKSTTQKNCAMQHPIWVNSPMTAPPVLEKSQTFDSPSISDSATSINVVPSNNMPAQKTIATRANTPAQEMLTVLPSEKLSHDFANSMAIPNQSDFIVSEAELSNLKQKMQPEKASENLPPHSPDASVTRDNSSQHSVVFHSSDPTAKDLNTSNVTEVKPNIIDQETTAKLLHGDLANPDKDLSTFADSALLPTNPSENLNPKGSHDEPTKTNPKESSQASSKSPSHSPEVVYDRENSVFNSLTAVTSREQPESENPNVSSSSCNTMNTPPCEAFELPKDNAYNTSDAGNKPKMVQEPHKLNMENSNVDEPFLDKRDLPEAATLHKSTHDQIVESVLPRSAKLSSLPDKSSNLFISSHNNLKKSNSYKPDSSSEPKQDQPEWPDSTKAAANLEDKNVSDEDLSSSEIEQCLPDDEAIEQFDEVLKELSSQVDFANVDSIFDSDLAITVKEKDENSDSCQVDGELEASAQKLDIGNSGLRVSSPPRSPGANSDSTIIFDVLCEICGTKLQYLGFDDLFVKLQANCLISEGSASVFIKAFNPSEITSEESSLDECNNATYINPVRVSLKFTEKFDGFEPAVKRSKLSSEVDFFNHDFVYDLSDRYFPCQCRCKEVFLIFNLWLHFREADVDGKRAEVNIYNSTMSRNVLRACSCMEIQAFDFNDSSHSFVKISNQELSKGSLRDSVYQIISSQV